MSESSNDTERFWALKSTNLKRVKDVESNYNVDKYSKLHSKINKPNRSTVSDFRKSSYPVLPDVPPRRQSSQSQMSKVSENHSNLDSASTSDYGSDASVQASPHLSKPAPAKIIDNTFYHGLQKGLSTKINYNNSNTNQKDSRTKDSKTFVLRGSHTHVTASRNRNGMTLQLFHIIQLISLEIIDEALEDEIVLDVMIDAFKEIQLEVEQFKVRIAPVVRMTAEQILSEAIDQIIQETVLMVMMKDSKSHLRAQIATRWTLEDIMQSLLTDVTHDAVHDLVNDKLTMARSDHIYNKLVDEFISEDIRSSGESLMVESMLEQILEEQVVVPVVEDSSRAIGTDMLQYYFQKVSRINLHQISTLATERPLADLLMTHLASVSARQRIVYGPSLMAQYCFENMVVDILLSKGSEIYSRLADTIDSRPLCTFHKELNQDVASDSLLEELIEYTDADLCDLDEEEVQEHFIPRYLGDLDKEIYSNHEPQ